MKLYEVVIENASFTHPTEGVIERYIVRKYKVIEHWEFRASEYCNTKEQAQEAAKRLRDETTT